MDGFLNFPSMAKIALSFHHLKSEDSDERDTQEHDTLLTLLENEIIPSLL
jgi:hypothetical protein